MLLARKTTFTLLALAFSVTVLTAFHPQKGGKAKEAAAPAPGEHVESLTELGVTIRIPATFAELAPIDEKERSSQIKAAWNAKLGASSVSILFYALPEPEFEFEEPEDISDFLLDDFRDQRDASFAFTKVELVNGPLGTTPYASAAYGSIRDTDGKTVKGSYLVLAGLLEKHGYSLEINADPALDSANEKLALDFLRKGLSYKGPTRKAEWTDAEVKARWEKDAPPELAKKLEKAVRTKHYIFLSNTSASKIMGDEMEKSYAAIQKMYPFPEVPGRRLMPVFLFRNPEEYHAFYAKAFETTVAEAAESKGVASDDFYATYYEAPGDPVHIHEMTHQIFKNRLRLGGGGSWFQEGVAEYISTKAPDRTEASNAVKKGRHTKLVEFLAIPSLLGSAQEDKKGDNIAANSYAQAALLIEFLREDKWSKAKFLDWVHAIGLCPRGNFIAIERATKETLGVDIAELEKRFVEYCKKR